MRFGVLSGRDLPADLTRRWTEIQEADDDLASPYFRPEFTQLVAAVRDDVRIGIMEDANRVVGFFPFHRGRGGIARPIGLGLSDYHGVIADPDADWTVQDLLRGLGLNRYDFDHVPASQKPFAGFTHRTAESPIIEVDSGYPAFRASRDKAGRKQLREVERKRQRMESTSKPLRFVSDCRDGSTLRTLMQWKSEQCRQTGTVDYFSLAWCAALVERLHSTRSPAFAGQLFALYSGDTLVAAHFVMRTDRIWHSWFPTYRREYHQFSPGLVLLLEMIRSASEGCTRYIDLGKGASLYKRRLMTGSIRVAEGRAELSSLLNQARHLRDRAEAWSRTSVLRPVLRLPGRVIRNLERHRRYG